MSWIKLTIECFWRRSFVCRMFHRTRKYYILELLHLSDRRQVAHTRVGVKGQRWRSNIIKLSYQNSNWCRKVDEIFVKIRTSGSVKVLTSWMILTAASSSSSTSCGISGRDDTNFRSATSSWANITAWTIPHHNSYLIQSRYRHR